MAAHAMRTDIIVWILLAATAVLVLIAIMGMA